MVAVLAGCGSASTGGGPATGATSDRSGSADPSSASATSTPGPVATESNPPGDIPDNQAFVAYASAAGGFVVKVPEGWARTGSGAEVTFTDKLNSVGVAEASSATAPTVASVRATLVPLLQSVPKLQLLGVKPVSRPAGAGVLVTYLADSAPDPVTGKVVRDSVERYLFWRSGRLVTLTLTGPRGADNVDPWRKVTDSLGWTR